MSKYIIKAIDQTIMPIFCIKIVFSQLLQKIADNFIVGGGEGKDQSRIDPFFHIEYLDRYYSQSPILSSHPKIPIFFLNIYIICFQTLVGSRKTACKFLKFHYISKLCCV